MSTLGEFYALLAAGETVRAVIRAPFSYSSSLGEDGYTFRIGSGPLRGRKATATTFDEAVRTATAAPVPTPDGAA